MENVGLNIVTNNISGQTKFDLKKPLFSKKEDKPIAINHSLDNSVKIQLNSNQSSLTVKSEYELKRNKKNENLGSVAKKELPEIDKNLEPKDQVAKFLLEYVYGVNITIKFYKEDFNTQDVTKNQTKNNDNNLLPPKRLDILT